PDPCATTLDALRRLRELPLGRSRDFDVFYLSLSSTLRSFISGWFHEDATHKVTDEICSRLMSMGLLSREYGRRLLLLLEQSDWVKFSTGRPTAEQARLDLAEAESFVRHVAEAACPEPMPRGRTVGGDP
ncbi:MAG: hypothetical protein ABIK28_15550, partial [Planctomycetota bacterium]